MNREVYRVTIHHSCNSGPAAERLARVIIDRWMPGNGGGVLVLLGPQLLCVLLPFFLKAKLQRRDVTISVDTTDPQPVITEIP